MSKYHQQKRSSRSVASDDDNADQLITTKRVRVLLGHCSEMHIWRLVHLEAYRELGFPKPAMINRRNYWSEREVSAWIKKQLETGRQALAA